MSFNWRPLLTFSTRSIFIGHTQTDITSPSTGYFFLRDALKTHTDTYQNKIKLFRVLCYSRAMFMGKKCYKIYFTIRCCCETLLGETKEKLYNRSICVTSSYSSSLLLGLSCVFCYKPTHTHTHTRLCHKQSCPKKFFFEQHWNVYCCIISKKR